MQSEYNVRKNLENSLGESVVGLLLKTTYKMER